MTTTAAVPLTVVTGGGRGIGAATCLRLARDGHDVVVGYLRRADAAERVAGAARELGRRAVAVQVDTTDGASLAHLIERAERLAPVTGLVANAGSISAVGRLENLDLDAVRRDLEVDLFGVVASVQAGIPALRRAGGGAVVMMSSGAATLGSPGEFVHYAAAKAGVDALTLGLSKELAADRIRVNGVAPGLVTTDFHPDAARVDRMAPTIPMGRPAHPDEIAAAVAWLLSADASYTTGAVLRVAGGR